MTVRQGLAFWKAFPQWAAVAAFAAVLGWSATASAGLLTGVADVEQLPMEFEGQGDEDMIMVGSESQPIPIVPDPEGPPWMKQFLIDRSGQGLSNGETITVMEFLVFPPPDPSGSGATTKRVIDWHEDIDPTVGDGDDFEWAGGGIEILGAGAPPIPGTVSDDGKSIWFDFPSFPPDVPIKISKQLVWTGPTITGTGNPVFEVKVNERPSIVPEPNAAVLVGLLLVSATAVVRRRDC